MGVSYFYKISTASSFGSSFKILRLYQGGLLQHLLGSFCLYFAVYFALGMTYDNILVHHKGFKYSFEYICRVCDSKVMDIPLTLILGFYVTQVVIRWWSIYKSLGWPDRLSMKLSCHAPGNHRTDKNNKIVDLTELRLARRTIARYASLASILTLRTMSSRMAKRFKDPDAMVKANVLTNEEKAKLESGNKRVKNKFALYWLPCVWIEEVLNHMFQSGMFSSDVGYVDVVNEAQNFNSLNASLVGYAWNNFPLPYVQLATLCSYSYFWVAIFGSQNLHPDPENWEKLGWTESVRASKTPECAIPVLLMIQFVIYLGWFKVAETLLNPLGEDVNDFDMNTFVDRNIAASMIMVDAEGQGFSCHYKNCDKKDANDKGHEDDQFKDPFGLSVIPLELPHTRSSMEVARKENPVPTAKSMMKSMGFDDKDLETKPVEFFSEGAQLVKHRRSNKKTPLRSFSTNMSMMKRGPFRQNLALRQFEKRENLRRDVLNNDLKSDNDVEKGERL